MGQCIDLTTMSTQYDVIICGGGLAGSAAGVTLVQRGFSVAILDRAQFPRRKLCGGLLTWKSLQLLEKVFGETVESLTEAGVINFASSEYRINTFSGPLAQGTLTFPFHLVDRTRFDALLLDHARKAGAEVFEGSKVVECDPEAGRVTLDSGDIFEGKYVIGADGANSVVRGSFSDYDRDRFKQLMAPTIEIKIDAKDFPRPVACPELYIGQLEAGYGWVFPNKDRVVVGICGLRQDNENFSEIFREYLDHLKVDPEVVPEFKGHPLPYGNYLGNPVCGRTLLAGDAGGYVEPLLGEGIFFALCTGFYAGLSVAEGLEKRTHPGTLYSRRIHTDIMDELIASNRLRWTLFSAMKYLGTGSIGLFVKSLPTSLTEMVHGIRSYAWLCKKQWGFLDED